MVYCLFRSDFINNLGLMFWKSSQVTLNSNEVMENQGVGVYVREKSRGNFTNNQVIKSMKNSD